MSPTAIVTAAGRYCWRADFAGDIDIGLPASSDSSTTECFVVNPVKPTIATTAGAGPVDFGQPVTDTATLTGTAHKPGTGGPTGSALAGSIDPTTLGGDATGTITFTLYKDGGCTLANKATGTGTNPQTVTVSGDGSYGPVSFTPDAPGTYRWVAQYGGDLPNTLASDAGACNDPDEDVVVRQIKTQIKTKQSWYPNDTAEIKAETGNLAAGGNVTFSLYNNATCTGTAVYEDLVNPIGGGNSTETESTSNTTFAINTQFADPAASVTGRYSWKVVYTPAASDTAHLGIQSSCSEFFNITYTNDNGPGTALTP